MTYRYGIDPERDAATFEQELLETTMPRPSKQTKQTPPPVLRRNAGVRIEVHGEPLERDFDGRDRGPRFRVCLPEPADHVTLPGPVVELGPVEDPTPKGGRRGAVLEVIRKSPTPLTPAEIADALGDQTPEGTRRVEIACSVMARDGVLARSAARGSSAANGPRGTAYSIPR